MAVQPKKLEQKKLNNFETLQISHPLKYTNKTKMYTTKGLQ